MKIVITPQEAIERGIWPELCLIEGLNEWTVNEGSIDSDHEIILSEIEARSLGLLGGEKS